MNPEKQRIGIAEACGYKDIELRLICEGTGMDAWVFCSGVLGQGGVEIPDYLNDLNAMYAAEKALTDDQLERMCAQLLVLTSPTRPFPDLRYDTVRRMVHATAAQRAEAFLRTIGKWEEQPTTNSK